MNLLVLRFSAMGDVALMAPVLVAIAANHPKVQITVVTRGNYAPFFHNIPNIYVLGINFKKFKGFTGIFNLVKEINVLGPFHSVIDLHGSLRSRVISFLFWLKRVPVYRIIKGRREKMMQIRKKNKLKKLLPHTVQRYALVFQKAGFMAPLRGGPWINVDAESKIFAKVFFRSIGVPKKTGLWVGFAPFAGHKLKEWPWNKCVKMVQLIIGEIPEVRIFLFGSKEEKPMLEQLSAIAPNIHIVSGGNLGIRGDLGIMEKLDLLIGMDSSNVHIAALLKKPVIAIYGTTHPISGFGPFAQEDVGVLQIDLPCRPCSIYGNTTCYRGDFACMEMIQPEDVLRRIRLIQNMNTVW